MCLNYRVKLSNGERCKIYKIFDAIDIIVPKVNNTSRKRLISINYILKMIFIMMAIPCDKIPISKSRKTLTFYSKYWDKIVSYW